MEHRSLIATMPGGSSGKARPGRGMGWRVMLPSPPRQHQRQADILRSAPGSAGMPASIGLGEAGHPGNGPDLDRKALAGGRARTTGAGPWTGHSMVRTWNRWDARQYWPGRGTGHPGNGPGLDPGTRQTGDPGPRWPNPGRGGFPEGQLRQDSIRRRSKSGHTMKTAPMAPPLGSEGSLCSMKLPRM
jgi:hypothetical protein